MNEFALLGRQNQHVVVVALAEGEHGFQSGQNLRGAEQDLKSVFVCRKHGIQDRCRRRGRRIGGISQCDDALVQKLAQLLQHLIAGQRGQVQQFSYRWPFFRQLEEQLP